MSGGFHIPDQVFCEKPGTWKICVDGKVLEAEFVDTFSAQAGLANEQQHRARVEKLQSRGRGSDQRFYRDGRGL